MVGQDNDLDMARGFRDVIRSSMALGTLSSVLLLLVLFVKPIQLRLKFILVFQ